MAIYKGFNPTRPAAGFHVHGMIVLGEGTAFFSPVLLNKLKPQNHTGLGSQSIQGNLINSRVSERQILDVANIYLTDKLTADELKIILNNWNKFEFAIGVGDRRPGAVSRFAIASNWHGEDVNNLLLRPNPPDAPEYDLRLTFSAKDETLKLTDNHVSVPNTYGGLRYFTIRVKS